MLDVATGQRHVLQVGQPAVLLVVGEQHLATPDRAVRTVTGAVEGEPEYLLGAGEPVLGHHRCDVRMVMLHVPDWFGAAVATRPCGGAVSGMAVSDHDLGVDARECAQVPLGRVERRERGEVVHVADVLAQPRVPALGDGQRVLQVGADRQRRRHVDGQGDGQRGVPAGSPDGQLDGPDSAPPRSTTRTTESSHGTRISLSCISHPSARPASRSRASSSVKQIGSPPRLPDVITRICGPGSSPGSPNSSACSGA